MTESPRRLRARLHVSPHGNLFMVEIAQLVAAALRDLAIDTELVSDRLPEATSGVCNIVVAPHEFFPLHRGVSAAAAAEAAAASVLVTTEQPGTAWYEVSHEYARVAKAVFDINELSVRAFELDGIDAHRLALGYHESWDRRAATGPRDHDVVFMGSLTKKREEALARLAPVLDSRRSRLLVHDGAVPVTEGSEYFLTGDAKHDLLARTKVLLNFHRSDVPYVEWHRLLGALTNGCAVLTEPVDSYDPLEPWSHFFVAPIDDFGAYLQMLLAADDLREQVAEAAYDLVRTEYRMVDLLRPFLPILEHAASARTGHVRVANAAARLADAAPDDEDARVVRLQPIPTPTPAQRALKRSLLNQTRLARRVDTLLCRLEHGVDQHIETIETPSFETARADVAVVLPVYNYAQHVREALVSAIDSVGVSIEVIVVDDHSSDESRAVVERVMHDRADAAVRLVALHANRGLSAVRNLALSHVRAPLVFFLDADNALYPHGLQRLERALARDSDAAVAYGMIAGFGDDDRMVSAYPWDPERLVFGNYIDAMALVRRSVLDAVGGYSLEMQDQHGGWEDYELWLRLAARGERGVLVPEIVGRYRVHAASMVATVNLDVASTYSYLRDRYPELPWPATVEVPA
ncbi:MAG TPA: glycosyltransferase [Acidimicrobiia bacterium]|nr:glycosyltransferase [Acidimicrobiia bacterium]